jgi:hypothetical protein
VTHGGRAREELGEANDPGIGRGIGPHFVFRTKEEVVTVERRETRIAAQLGGLRERAMRACSAALPLFAALTLLPLDSPRGADAYTLAPLGPRRLHVASGVSRLAPAARPRAPGLRCTPNPGLLCRTRTLISLLPFQAALVRLH